MHDTDKTAADTASDTRKAQTEGEGARALQQAAERIVQGGNEAEILAALLATQPAESHAKLKEKLAQLVKQHRMQDALVKKDAQEKEEKRKRLAFSLATAVLMMTKGTFRVIREMLVRNPSVEQQVKQIGGKLLASGVTPDMLMAERMEQIRVRAMARLQAQRQQQEEAPAQQR